MAGFRQTGLLAANGSVTFPAFIFKNALAAYNGTGSRLKVSGFRRQDADRQLVVQVREVEIGSFNEKQWGFAVFYGQRASYGVQVISAWSPQSAVG
jgi:hypothetical protein